MKFLKINPGEGFKVLIFFILAFLVQAGVILGVSIADGLYLTKLGVERLPQAFLGMPVMMIIAVPVFGYLLNRIGIQRLLTLIFILLVLGGLLFGAWLHVSNEDGFWVVYLLKLYSYLWFVITYTLYWNFVGEYFYLLDAKRLYPLLSGGLTLGGVFGGYIVGYFGAIISSSYILVCWSVLAVLAFLVFLVVSATCRKVTEEDFSESVYTGQSFIDNLRMIFNNRFALIISIVFFAGVVLAALGEYQYSTVFSSIYEETELIGFFGSMFAIASAINFVINFFIFSRLVHLIGVRNVVFIYPVTIVVAFGIFSLYESFETALIIFFVTQSVLISIDLNNWNFIYRAFASSLQKTLRLFTESIIDPLATSIAGIFLIAASAFSFSSTQVSMLALGICFLHLLFAFILKSNYLRAVVEALRKDGFEFFKDMSLIAKGLSSKDVALVEKELLEEEEEALFFYFSLLWSYNKEKAVKSLLMRFEKKAIKNIDVFKVIFDMVFDLKKDYDLIKIVISWVKKNYHNAPIYLMDQLVRYNYVNYSEVPYRNEGTVSDLRMAYFISRWSSSPDIGDSLEVLDELNKMIASNEEDNILNAIEVLGHIGEVKYLDLLENYLDHPSADIREQAIRSIEKLVDDTSDRILPKLIERFPLEKKRSQRKLLHSMSLIKDPNVSSQLLQIGETMSPLERRAIFRTVCGFGLKAVPQVISTLNNNEEYSLGARSLSAKVLSYLAFPQLEALSVKIIDAQINKAYELLHMHAVLMEYEGRTAISVSLLTRFYREMHEEEVNYVLEILALSGQIPDFELLKTSLRSDNLQIKGNAIEALEQGVPRSVFRLLLPLIDSRSIRAKTDFYLTKILSKSESKAKRSVIFDKIIEMTLNSSYLTGNAIALQIIWENEPARFDKQIQTILKSPSEYLDGKQNILIEIINSLFERDNRKIETYNLVERLAVMVKNQFWKNVAIENLLPIARSSKEINSDELKVDEERDANFFYLVMEGELTFTVNSQKQTAGVGDFIGKGETFFEKVNYKIIDNKKMKLLKFNKEELLHLAEFSPDVGLLILKDVI